VDEELTWGGPTADTVPEIVVPVPSRVTVARSPTFACTDCVGLSVPCNSKLPVLSTVMVPVEELALTG
jgi:hypothetical protein